MSLRSTDSLKHVTDDPIRVMLIHNYVTYAQIGLSHNAREKKAHSNFPDNVIS